MNGVIKERKKGEDQGGTGGRGEKRRETGVGGVGGGIRER